MKSRHAFWTGRQGVIQIVVIASVLLLGISFLLSADSLTASAGGASGAAIAPASGANASFFTLGNIFVIGFFALSAVVGGGVSFFLRKQKKGSAPEN
jgi:hypothetical protein